MTLKYNFLKKYMYQDCKGPWNGMDNVFYPVTEEEISEAEKQIGFLFPSELKEFYVEIGYGHLASPKNSDGKCEFPPSNEILSPLVASHFYNLVIVHHTKQKEEHPAEDEFLDLDNFYNRYKGNSISMGALDCINPGDIPFFELYDSSNFFMLKPNSDHPNAVWTFGDIKIEDSFERFIWRLYHESPWFYDEIIEEHYKNHPKVG